MDFELTEEQAALLASVTKLVTNEFGDVRQSGNIHTTPIREAIGTLSRHGFGGISVPEAQGGQGGTLLDAVLVIESVAQVNPVAGDGVQALNFGAVQQLAHHGTEELRRAFLEPCLNGRLITAIAMTEPEAGSAVTELRSTARYDGDEVVLHGQKIFTTHGPEADFFVVWARFGDDRDNVGAVVVGREARGFAVDSSNEFMSGEHYGMLYFDGCRVPASQVLLDEDGFRKMFPVFNIERLGNAARSLALGQAAFDLALDYAQQRQQFGHPLADFQGLQWRLAELALKLESARVLLYRAATRADETTPRSWETSMAKLACNRVGFEAADAAVQVFGAYGYDNDSVVNYLFRRTRGWMIAGGTIEQMLDRISRSLLRGTGKPGTPRRARDDAAGT